MTEDTFTARLFNPQQGYQALLAARMHAKAWLVAGQRLILEIRPETRSDAQNRLLHALIGDVAKQAEWLGKKRAAIEWKILFVSGHAVATKQGAEMIPGLENEFVNIRESTAKMGSKRISSLVEYIYAWGALHGVEWREARQWMVDSGVM